MFPGIWALIKPNKPAVINSVSGEQTSYQELNERSIQLARLFREKGLRKGDHIAIFMENHLRYHEVAWAALRSGLYITPINRYLTAEEAGYILDNCNAQALVSSKKLAETASQLKEFAPQCHIWLMVDGATAHYDSYEKTIDSYPTDALSEEPAGEYMFYSSGTTGKPKGIVRTPREQGIADELSPIANLLKELWGADEHSVYLSPAPLYHSAPIAFSTGIQAIGGTVIMMPRFDETQALESIDKYQVTHSQWVPTMFTRMLKMPENQRYTYDLSSHRVAIHAAAPCPKEIKKKMFEWWGPIIHEYYGGSELNGLTYCKPQDWLEHPGTVGKALLGKLHICDEDGRELPAGEAGLIYFELPEMVFQYHNDPEKTRSSQHPEHPNWSALGDIGYVDNDGFLFLTDRATFMIISGGVNIYPQEIEDTLIMHDKIADVAVIGVPSEEMGEEVKAVVQLAEDLDAIDSSSQTALTEELMNYARQHLAHYKCPRSIDFIGELPRLPTGKLYKRLLKDKYWGKTDSRIV